MNIRNLFRILLLIPLFGMSNVPANATIDPVQAMSIFQQAHSICDRDAGALWGHTLCGPMLLVDPDDHSAVANQADAGGLLRREGDVFIGTLPSTVTISDTTVTWSGTRWCELMWPWPMREDPDYRHVTLAHEMFHRIEIDDLHFRVTEGDNRHLDTLEGRYLMEMEWRALSSALQAKTPGDMKVAIQDAILFRSERHAKFAGADINETKLESNEGIAEYTGVRIGLPTSDERTRYALRDLSAYAEAPSLVRSFAYATGSAWGLLLDLASPDWRKDFLRNPSEVRFDQRLSDALHLDKPELKSASERHAVYDPNGVLRAHEVARDQERRARAAEYKAKLADGPVMTLPLEHSSYQFKPGTLVALEHLGTVYPTMTLNAAWGTVTVESGGVLIHDDPHVATISAVNFDSSTLQGPGYRLVLNPGWKVVPGQRAGDLVVKGTP